MASLRQAARAANSATLEEAKRYMLDFYRMVGGAREGSATETTRVGTTRSFHHDNDKNRWSDGADVGSCPHVRKSVDNRAREATLGRMDGETDEEYSSLGVWKTGLPGSPIRRETIQLARASYCAAAAEQHRGNVPKECTRHGSEGAIEMTRRNVRAHRSLGARSD